MGSGYPLTLQGSSPEGLSWGEGTVPGREAAQRLCPTPEGAFLAASPRGGSATCCPWGSLCGANSRLPNQLKENRFLQNVDRCAQRNMISRIQAL